MLVEPVEQLGCGEGDGERRASAFLKKGSLSEDDFAQSVVS